MDTYLLSLSNHTIGARAAGKKALRQQQYPCFVRPIQLSLFENEQQETTDYLFYTYSQQPQQSYYRHYSS